MTTIALYPGSFDPITNGHADIIARAARVFDRVVVGVAESEQKQTVFSQEQRLAWVSELFSAQENVDVVGFSGLTIELAKQHGANVMLRGLRAISDFEYEFELANMNRSMAPEIETMFMLPSGGQAHISASIVREIASMGGDIKPFVHEVVAKGLYSHYKQ